MRTWSHALSAAFTVVLLFGCTHMNKKPVETVTRATVASLDFPKGRFVAIQGATSNHETMINLVVPRLRNYIYQVTGDNGTTAEIEMYSTVHFPTLLWKVDKLHIRRLSPGVAYKLTVIEDFREKRTVVDEREFGALDLGRKDVTFAFATCMSDDSRFEPLIDPMWAKLVAAAPDMIVLGGDTVYVDLFDFVERQKATEQDIWMRYLDATKRIPIYRAKRLIPILATWDDHDFGTNDADRTFKSKVAARKVFQAFFGGRAIANVYDPGTDSVRASFAGFGQRFFLMDDRTFRQPKDAKKPETYAHWGEAQHKWLMTNLAASAEPAWIFNGGQIFNGKKNAVKESFEGDHPKHFETFLRDLKTVQAPVVFASGDIHFSEILALEKSRLGYQSYEFTSSSLHSWAPEKEWENSLRMVSTVKFNFLLIRSRSEGTGLSLSVESRGLDEKPYFSESLSVKR